MSLGERGRTTNSRPTSPGAHHPRKSSSLSMSGNSGTPGSRDAQSSSFSRSLPRILSIAFATVILVQQSQLARVNQSSLDASLLSLVSSSSNVPPYLSSSSSSSSSASSPSSTTSFMGSFFQHGGATPLPALPYPDPLATDAARYRNKVDGYGDPVHLGGAIGYNPAVISPRIFALTRHQWGVQSLLDVGCGRGWSTLWYQMQGVRTQCVEGSPAAIRASLLPASTIVAHDFTRGPWWPEDTVDMVWSTNFVQQVSKQYAPNYFAAMSKAAIVVVSFPRNGGWHAVEVHDLDYWVLQFELRGFQLHKKLTDQLHAAAVHEYESNDIGPDGKRVRAIDLLTDVKVFINPHVASLPAHAHLFPEPGCFKGRENNGTLVQRECSTNRGFGLETKLDEAFAAPPIDDVMVRAWETHVKRHLQVDRESAGANGGSSDMPMTPSVNLTDHVVVQIPAHLDRGNRTLGNVKVVVVVWPLWEFGVGNAESLHVEKNGVQESPWMELSNDPNNFDPNVVWVGDTGYAYSWTVWCNKFNEHVMSAKARRMELGLPTSWPIYIVDWTDGFSKQRCRGVEQTVGEEFVFYSTRSIIKGRRWNVKNKWVEMGTSISLVDGKKVYRHTSLIVRTDTIEALQSELQERGMTLRDPIERLERPVDVTHLWPRSNGTVGSRGVGEIKSELRTHISDEIWKLAHPDPSLSASASAFTSALGRNLTAMVGLAGTTSRAGRRGVSSAYVEAMLATKIILVTQRDGWEDHYRLFEGLVSGALVFTDRMLSLPSGLKNGTSVVEFGSLDELKSLIAHYLRHPDERLRIAAEGRRVAMSRHRSWHRVEEVIFGRALTVCEEGKEGTDCPYIVHANETDALESS